MGCHHLPSDTMTTKHADNMPVLAAGYDSTAATGGDVAMAKFDNGTYSLSAGTGGAWSGQGWTVLVNHTDNATPQEPVKVAVSGDGSVYAMTYNEQSTDNSSIVIFYDE